MANTVLQIRRTSISGRTPNTTTSANTQFINQGELALNMADFKMFSSNGSAFFEIGANVKITDGPFKGFEGKVSEIDKERGKIKVLVNMFGRDTPVELDSLQIKKVEGQ